MKKYMIFAFSCILVLFLAACTPTPPQPSDLQTPQYTVTVPDSNFEVTEEEVHTAEDGIKVISGTAQSAATTLLPETIWSADQTVTYHAFTLPDKAAFDNGSIGLLSVPSIGLSVNVYEAEDEMEAMKNGAAHFKSTSSWDGNIGLSAHNATANGEEAFFKDLHKISLGDTLTYQTALGERIYVVSSIKTVTDDDWSYLSRASDNRITMLTCISGQPTKRLMVQAVQK